MGSDLFEEVALAARTGTITVRGGYGREKVWLGINTKNAPEEHPEIGIWLTPRQQAGLVDAISQMVAVHLEDLISQRKTLEDTLEKIREIADEAIIDL